MKVRIPFVVNSKGRWYAGGGKNAVKEPDWGFLMDCADDVDSSSDFLQGWITVDLPVPTIAEVEGTTETLGRQCGGHPMQDFRRSEIWHPIALAPAEEVVETKIDDEHGERNVQSLIRQGNLWFFPDKSMYVYYTPTHWRRS